MIAIDPGPFVFVLHMHLKKRHIYMCRVLRATKIRVFCVCFMCVLCVYSTEHPFIAINRNAGLVLTSYLAQSVFYTKLHYNGSPFFCFTANLGLAFFPLVFLISTVHILL